MQLPTLIKLTASLIFASASVFAQTTLIQNIHGYTLDNAGEKLIQFSALQN